MAKHPSRRFHLSVAAGTALVVLAFLLPTAARAAPTAPTTPDTVTSVTDKLQSISQQNELLAEKTNLVVADVAAKQAALTSAQDAATAAAAVYASAHEVLKQTIVAQYEGRSFSRTGALLTSSSDADYLQQLSLLNLVAQQRAEVLAQVTEAQSAAQAAETKANDLLNQANTARAALQRQQQSLATDQAKYELLLATLTTAQRATFQSTGAPTAVQLVAATAQPATSAGAAAAVRYALAQVGKPYVYDAAGPDSFDCSGLTMMAWQAGGVSLPHNAEAQSHYGTHVAVAQLQPGDLLFYYQPIGHVTIYIGGGLMASAPQPGENVKIVSVASAMGDFVSATHL